MKQIINYHVNRLINLFIDFDFFNCLPFFSKDILIDVNGRVIIGKRDVIYFLKFKRFELFKERLIGFKVGEVFLSERTKAVVKGNANFEKSSVEVCLKLSFNFVKDDQLEINEIEICK